MVKINKTLGLALLTALAASCSSDNDVTGTNNPTIDNGEANYATLKIDLPTRAGVRAVDFNDGQPSEYAVNDATLLVFKKAGSSENDYTFVESVDLGDMNPWQKSSATGITTTANVTAELHSATLTDLKAGNIYGLVILNNKADNGTTDKITLPTTVGTTYKAWNVDGNAKAMENTQKGIVMANAPQWTASSVPPTTLVQIDGSKVMPTKAQAEAAGAAADIHVERGLAKVTLAQYGNDNTIPVDDKSTYKDCTVKLDAWALDVTNRTSFPIHKTDELNSTTNYADIWKYDASASQAPTTNRFQDHIAEFKRVYWGIDPNYSGSSLNQKTSLGDCKEAFNMVHDMTDEQKTAAFKTTFGDDNPQYCLENTFDIDNMTQGQTTRVLIKATFSVPTTKGGDDGYLADGDNYKSGDNLYKVDNLAGLFTSYQLSQEISDYILLNFGKKDVTVTIDDTEIAKTAGLHQLAAENFRTSSSPAKVRTRASGYPVLPGLTEDESEKVVKAFKITTYKDGVCYYVGRIKHFGDDETPWEVGNPTYGSDNQKWLGRYGVLRNNWYSLSVGSVSAPGDPEIPEVVPENPDDDNFNYINLSVNVLNWAKRTDGFDL